MCREWSTPHCLQSFQNPRNTGWLPVDCHLIVHNPLHRTGHVVNVRPMPFRGGLVCGREREQAIGRGGLLLRDWAVFPREGAVPMPVARFVQSCLIMVCPIVAAKRFGWPRWLQRHREELVAVQRIPREELELIHGLSGRPLHAVNHHRDTRDRVQRLRIMRSARCISTCVYVDILKAVHPRKRSNANIGLTM